MVCQRPAGPVETQAWTVLHAAASHQVWQLPVPAKGHVEPTWQPDLPALHSIHTAPEGKVAPGPIQGRHMGPSSLL